MHGIRRKGWALHAMLARKNGILAHLPAPVSSDSTSPQSPVARSGGSSTWNLQQPMMMCLDCTVAFAGRVSQAVCVRNIDVTPAVTDNSGLLQRMGDNRNRVPLHADQLRQGFLSQRQCFSAA